VKEQAFNYMWDGINWEKEGVRHILLKHNLSNELSRMGNKYE
jgi:hypothetical protein